MSSNTASIAAQLAEFSIHTDTADIPDPVRERARYLVLDALGIAFASTRYDFARRSLAAMRSMGTGDIPVIGNNEKLTLRDAVIMNGILIHGLDFDDTHTRGVIHATASTLPCALALAAKRGSSGRDMLTAYIVGMEAATRLASVANGGFHQIGFHPTGIVGAFACALVSARLTELDIGQAAHAQGIALSMASGSLEFLQDGAWTKRLHPGWAGAAGITAAALAREGFVGTTATYEGRFGLYKLYLGALASDCELQQATADLGSVWEISNVAVKPLPACHFTHASADAAIALHRLYGFTPDDIANVCVRVPQKVIPIVCEPLANKRQPANSYDAQFSIPYIVATCLAKGRFTLDELDDAAIGDPQVLSLASRVRYEVDPDSTFPRHYSGEVVVNTIDGQTVHHRESVNRGCADRPLSNDDIVAKYHDNVCRALSTKRAQEIREAVLALDNLDNTARLADLIGRIA